MLLEFSVTNFKCLHNKQTLSLVASPDKVNRKDHVFKTPGSHADLLHTAAIYGANASGKSSLLQALSAMAYWVKHSSTKLQEGEKLKGIKPFMLSTPSQSQPTEFEIIFIHEGVKYQYGFEADRDRIHGEWLFASPGSRPQQWFERKYNAETGEDAWYFGPNFMGQKKLIQEATRANALFLSTGINLNHKQLKPVFYWFKEKLTLFTDDGTPPFDTMEMCQLKEGKDRVVQLLNSVDLGIDDIVIRKKMPPKLSLPPGLDEETKADILSQVEREMALKAYFYHRMPGEESRCGINFDDISRGTRTLFSWAGPLLKVLDQGGVLAVDELHNAMHPLLSEYLLKKFHSAQNTNHAQLIFTTHDTNLMSALRRDQIWLMQKDAETMASTLYPLSDFHPRKNEALAKGYTEGRYGGIPFIEDRI